MSTKQGSAGYPFFIWIGLWAALGFPAVGRAANSLNATNVTVSPTAVITSVVLTAGASTNTWTATANTNWLNIVPCGGSINTGSAAVVIGVQVNTGTERTGTLSIAGLTLTVVQRGASVATTLTATDVGITSVTLHGTVIPNASDTSGFFQYSTSGGWLVDTVVTGISDYCSARSALSQDHNGNFYICDPDCNLIHKIAATGGVSSVESPNIWYLGWRSPSSVIVDEDNNLYVSELWSIRKYTASTETWSVFAGDPTVTQESVDGVGTAARFRSILGMTRDSVGNFYVSCMYGIRKVTPNAVVTTLTDQGTSVGQRDGPAFGTPEIVAFIDGATGIAVDDYSGALYWGEYSFSYSCCVRRLNLTGSGMVTTLAGSSAGFTDGTGSVAQFYFPMNALVDKSGTLFVVDTAANNAIRKVTTNGVVTTLNCLDANTGSPVNFSQLVGGMVDSDGNLLVIDHGSDSIRQVGYRLSDPVSMAGPSGLSGTNAVAITNTVSGLFPGTTYYYWTAATNSVSTNHGDVMSFTTIQATTTLTLASSPNPSSYGEDVALMATVLTNTPGWPAASGSVVFKDAGIAIGTSTFSGGVATLITNSLGLGNNSLTAEYAGDTHYLGSTTTVAITQTVTQGVPNVTVWPTAGAICYGQTLASATLTGGTGTPTGTFSWVNAALAPDIGTSSHEVVFFPTDTGNYITVSGTVSVTVNKAASSITEWPTAGAINMGDPLSSSTLSGGSFVPAGSFAWISPTNRPYGGTAAQSVRFTPTDTNRYLSATGTVSVTVNAVPTTNTLTSSRNPSVEGESVTFRVTISTTSSNCYIPTGAVTFKDGASTLGVVTLSGGMAAFSTNGLSIGTHDITAEYAGNVSFLSSTSTPPLTQAVQPALIVLRNPDTNAVALSGTIINTQQTVATVFKIGTGNMRLVCAALRLRCDYSTSPSNDSIRCTLYDVTASNTPNTILAACDSSVLNIAKNDTSWYPVTFSGDLRDYLLQAGHTYALGISMPTAGSATNRSIMNIDEQGTPYTMAPGYTFVQNIRSTTATPAWSENANWFGIVLTGSEVPRTPTETYLSADVNTSLYGSAVTFTAAVTHESSTGTMMFRDAGVTLGTGVVSEGIAVFSTRYLSIGSHEITAEYGGDLAYEGSVSSTALTYTVLSPPSVITMSATGVVADGAALCGRVNPRGFTVDGFFQYATNTEWLVGTLAGCTNAGFADGIGGAAAFNHPAGVAVDGAGNVYVADTLNHSIRRIAPLGEATRLAGTNTLGSYIDGTGTTARFNAPFGVAVDGSNNIAVADTYNNCIRIVTPEGVVTTLAGTNVMGFADGPGAEALFNRPRGIAMDTAGNFVIADTLNHSIRKVTLEGVVTTLAGTNASGYADGTGLEARFNRPWGLAVDGAGNVLVADSFNHCIRKVTPEGNVTTLAGTNTAGCADGVGSAALFNTPSGVAVDGEGNILVTDSANHTLRRITPAGVVTTLTSTNAGYADGSGNAGQFNMPYGVAVNQADDVFVADYNNNRIRRVEHNLVAPVFSVAAQSGLTGTDTVEISRVISGLVTGRTYWFQAWITDGTYSNRGAVFSFTTPDSTLVVLCDFFLCEVNGEMRVCWQTASEKDTVGFDLFRLQNGVWLKVNEAFIRAVGEPGGRYSVSDSAANMSDTFCYKLVEYETDGNTQEYGPFDVAASNPRLQNITVMTNGVVIRWLGREQDSYEVLKSMDMKHGFESIASDLPATPPVNVYTDQAERAKGAYYRIRVE